MIERHCPKCRTIKAAGDFYARKNGAPGGYCKPCSKQTSAATYRSADREKIKEQKRKWVANAPDSYREARRKQTAKWRKANPEAAKERAVISARKRRSSVEGTLKNRMSAGMSASLNKRHAKKKSMKNWEALAGYTADELRAHIEGQFADGMTWENRNEWHIDHKRPLASFQFDGPDDPRFKEAWALDNLQPLWAKENQSKHAKLNWSRP